MEQFNRVSHLYSPFISLDPFRQYLHYPAVISELQKSQIGSVLDIGCGDGYFLKFLIDKGLATTGLGYDSASGQINLAVEKISPKLSDKITFQFADHKTARINPRFDNATSVMVLPYAQTVSELGEIFHATNTHLREGGRFISVIFNPTFDKFNLKMGARCFKRQDRVQVDIDFIEYTTQIVSFTSRLTQYSHNDYCTAAYSAGFVNLIWKNLLPSAAGITKLGISAWSDCIQFQPYQLLIAEK